MSLIFSDFWLGEPECGSRASRLGSMILRLETEAWSDKGLEGRWGRWMRR